MPADAASADGAAQSAAQSEGLDLPAEVRTRVIALAAEMLPLLARDQLPRSLRPVASFSPARRRIQRAATQIAVALDTDPAFRERVATQVRSRHPDLAGPVGDGVALPAADPIEVAALAYLLRPDGWQDRVRVAGEQSARDRADRAAAADQVDRDRSRAQLVETEAELRQVKERGREQLAAVKAENADLRRRLADVRRRLLEAQAAAERAGEEAKRSGARADDLVASADAEAHRLRARLTEAEAQAVEQRSGDRASRDAATTRARLLVETLEGAVQGLRRELALPAVDVLPADTVPAADPTGARATGATGPLLRADDPVLLDQLLGLPRVHVVVDGYNVTKTGYPSLPLDGQRARLLRDLAPVAARTGAELTVVFDGADLRHPPPVAGPRGVRVMFSRSGQTADELIAELVRAESVGRPLVVVSTDGEVAAEAESAAARAVPSATLLALLARA